MAAKPLTELKEGKTGKVTELHGGKEFRKRMTELGFDKCSEIRVVKKCGKAGPMIVELKGCGRMALGCGEAKKIIVESEGE